MTDKYNKLYRNIFHKIILFLSQKINFLIYEGIFFIISHFFLRKGKLFFQLKLIFIICTNKNIF